MPQIHVATISSKSLDPLPYHPSPSLSAVKPRNTKHPQHLSPTAHRDSSPEGSVRHEPEEEEYEDCYLDPRWHNPESDSGISLELYKHMPPHLLPQKEEIALEEIPETPKCSSLVPVNPDLVSSKQVNSFLNDAHKHGFHVILSPELLGFITSQQPLRQAFLHSLPQDDAKNSSGTGSLFDSGHGSDQTLPSTSDGADAEVPYDGRAVLTRPISAGTTL